MTRDELESGVRLMLDRIEKIEVERLLLAAQHTSDASGKRTTRCRYTTKADLLERGVVKGVASAELIITVTEVAE